MRQKHVQSLRYEDNTAFVHGYWERYEYLELLSQSSILAQKDARDRDKYRYSFVQDSYYALTGCAPVLSDNSFLLLWNNALESQWFAKLQALFGSSSMLKKVVAVRTMAHAVRLLCNLPDDADETMGAGQKDEDEEIIDQIASDEELFREILDELAEQEQQEEQTEQEQQEEQKGNQKSNEQTATAQSGGEKSGDNPPTEQAAGAQNNTQQKQNQTGQGEKQEQNRDARAGDGDRDTSDALFAPAQIGPLFDNNKPILPQKTNAASSIGGLVKKAEAVSDVTETLLSFLPGVDKDSDEVEVSAYVDGMKLSQLEYLAKMLGFARNVLLGAKRQVDATTGELTKYRHVSWSDALHPVDRSGLATLSLRTKVQLAEGTLRARMFKDQKPKGRGPVILLRDETASMASEPSGAIAYGKWHKSIVSKHSMALSFEIALASVFNQEGRDLVSIPWTHVQTRRYTYGEPGLKQHLRRFFHGYNTYIRDALSEAVHVASEYVDGADIVVLTDGYIADIASDFTDILKDYLKNNGRIWMILFDVPRTSTEMVIPWASGVIRVDHLTDDQAIADLLKQVNRKELDTTGKKVKL